MLRRLTGILGTGLVVIGATPAFAQATVQGHVSGGLANFMAPVIGGGVDAISAAGVGLGAGGLAVFVPGWALAGATARVSLNGRGSTGTQPFVAAELAALAESDCCGGSTGYGVAVGFTRRRNERSAFRFEGRLLLPFTGEGGLLLVQLGMTFRPTNGRDR